MRIISGNFKNKKLFFPKNLKTRPLKDSVRENLFNILEHSNDFEIKMSQIYIKDNSNNTIISQEPSFSERIATLRLMGIYRGNELKKHNLEFGDIESIYINRGPGSFAGIRNSLSIIKAIHIIKKIDYYCFSFDDFKGEIECNHENIPKLCSKFNIKKNLINPIYIS